MDDEDKKYPRRSGPGPAGRRGGPADAGPDRKRGGKPAFGAKKPFAKRDGPRKPYAPRADGTGTTEGARQKRDFAPRVAGEAERPRSGVKREYKPRDGGDGRRGERPFDKRPRGGGKPFTEREGQRKPYTPRGDRPMAAQGEGAEKRFERPKRDFGGDRARPQSPDGGFRPRPRPADAAPDAVGERIAKRLARAGLASRRDAEELIAAGRVKVNGKVLSSPAFNVMPGDIIHLDGMEIPPIERTRLFLFHKPAGVVTTNRDPEGRKTVFDVLPTDLPRLMTVGRLDINTEGLLLLTNDGGLARVLELPATGWLRRYRVRVHGKVEESALAGLRDGIAVDGVFYGAIEATLDREQGSNAWLTLALREGKNREVRNILGALGLDVTRLIRVSYGPFQLNDLPEGHVLEIKGRMLRDQLGERLVEESGANFDAEIARPFSNKPVRRTERHAEEPQRTRPARDGDRRPIGEGGLIKNRKRRESSRDEALGKLSTSREGTFAERGPKPERGDRTERGAFAGKPPRAGKKGEREQRPLEPPSQRKANVWMAPGARPIGKGRAEAEKADADARKARKPGGGKPFGKRVGDDRSAGRRDDGRQGERPRGDSPRGPRRGGSGADRRR